MSSTMIRPWLYTQHHNDAGTTLSKNLRGGFHLSLGHLATTLGLPTNIWRSACIIFQLLCCTPGGVKQSYTAWSTLMNISISVTASKASRRLTQVGCAICCEFKTSVPAGPCNLHQGSSLRGVHLQLGEWERIINSAPGEDCCWTIEFLVWSWSCETITEGQLRTSFGNQKTFFQAQQRNSLFPPFVHENRRHLLSLHALELLGIVWMTVLSL